jgi:hypothetical protein
MSVQAVHHEQLYNLLSEEKDRISHDNFTVRAELQEQATRFADEKIQYVEEFNTEQRNSEMEGDTRVAEQIRLISTVKAEMAAKVRLMQVLAAYLPFCKLNNICLSLSSIGADILHVGYD